MSFCHLYTGAAPPLVGLSLGDYWDCTRDGRRYCLTEFGWVPIDGDYSNVSKPIEQATHE